MAKQVPPQKKTTRGWLGCGIAVILLLLLAIVGVIGASIFGSRNWQKGLAIQVNILAPETGLQVEVQSPVELQASGTDPGGINRLEIYADGALIAAQDSPEAKGENPLVLNEIWTPMTTGRHVLMARGYSSDDKFADSSVVYVDVTEATVKELDVDSIPKPEGAANPSLADIAAAYGVSPDGLAGSNPSLSGTDPTAPLPPGTRISPPPSPDRSTGGSTGESPRAPRIGNPAAPTGLRVSADCSFATLNWTDSPDETSYRIYRITGDSRTVVGTVAANITTFRNALPVITGARTYRYQVAAVRDGREGLSLVVTVVTPATCPGAPAPPGTTSDLLLTVATVNTDASWQGLYCYLSMNSSPFEKIPPGDFTFFAPEPANNLYYNLTRTPNLGRYFINDHPTSVPVTLQGRCRGRRGAITDWLDSGYFSISHPQADWNGSMRTVNNGSYHFSYCLGPASRPCTPVIPGAAPGYIGFLDITELMFYLPPPTNLRVTSSVSACRAISDPIDQALCSLNMSLCSIFGNCEGQRALLWAWTASALVPESSLTGYTVERTTTNLTTASRRTNTWSVGLRPDGNLPKYIPGVESDLTCGSLVEYRARANQGSRVSTWSDPLVYTTRLCPNAAYIEVTFQTLQITDIDDRGEAACFICPARDTDIEPVGNINVSGGTLPWTTRNFTTSYRSTFLQLYEHDGWEAGTYNWSNVRTCVHSDSCGRINNVFTLDIVNPSANRIAFGSIIRDTDLFFAQTGSSYTEFCNVRQEIGPYTMEEWSSFNHTYTLTDNRNPEADCIITVNVHGYPVRR